MPVTSRAASTVLRRVAAVVRPVAVVLFVAAVPVFLIATNVRWVVNFPYLYSYGFDKYDVSERTLIERDELLSAGRQIRDYFNNDDEFLLVSVTRDGEQVDSLYNSREVLHMRDVKTLVKGVYRAQEVTGAYLALFALAGLAAWRLAFLRRLRRFLGLGGALTFGLVLLVGLGSLTGFDRVFVAFHEISFSNDLWLLSPQDFLIRMFPEAFFFDATMLIAGATVLQALLLSLLWWRPRRFPWRTHGLEPTPEGRGV